jgi:hypothetical protein
MLQSLTWLIQKFLYRIVKFQIRLIHQIVLYVLKDSIWPKANVFLCLHIVMGSISPTETVLPVSLDSYSKMEFVPIQTA